MLGHDTGTSYLSFRGKMGTNNTMSDKVKINVTSPGTASFSSGAGGTVRLGGISEPSADNDAANKKYVDGKAQGLTLKGTVAYITIGNLPGVYSYSSATDNTGGFFITSNAGDWGNVTNKMLDISDPSASNTTTELVSQAMSDSAWKLANVQFKSSAWEYYNGDAAAPGNNTSVRTHWPTRVLVNAQSNAKENGIYYLYDYSSDTEAKWVLKRASNFDSTPAGEVHAGAFVFVEDGFRHKNHGFTLMQPDMPLVDNTMQLNNGSDTSSGHEIRFEQFSGAGQLQAGPNVSISGDQIGTVQVPSFTKASFTATGSTDKTDFGHSVDIAGNLKVTSAGDPGNNIYAVECKNLYVSETSKLKKLTIEGSADGQGNMDGIATAGAIVCTDSVSGVRAKKVILGIDKDATGGYTSATGSLEFGTMECKMPDGLSDFQKIKVQKGGEFQSDCTFAQNVGTSTLTSSSTITSAGEVRITAADVAGSSVALKVTQGTTSLKATNTDILTATQIRTSGSGDIKVGWDGSTANGDIYCNAMNATSFVADTLVANVSTQAKACTAETVDVSGQLAGQKAGFGVWVGEGVHSKKLQTTQNVEVGSNLTVGSSATVTGDLIARSGLKCENGAAKMPISAGTVTAQKVKDCVLEGVTAASGQGVFAWTSGLFTVTPEITASGGVNASSKDVRAQWVQAGTGSNDGTSNASYGVVSQGGVKSTAADVFAKTDLIAETGSVKAVKLDITMPGSAAASHEVHGNITVSKGRSTFTTSGQDSGNTNTDAVFVNAGDITIHTGGLKMDGSASGFAHAGEYIEMTNTTTGSGLIVTPGTMSAGKIRAGSVATGRDVTGAAGGEVECGSVTCHGNVACQTAGVYKAGSALSTVSIDNCNLTIGAGSQGDAAIGTETLTCPNISAGKTVFITGTAGSVSLKVDSGIAQLPTTKVSSLETLSGGAITCSGKLNMSDNIKFHSGAIEGPTSVTTSGSDSYVQSHNFYALSDEKLKKNIKPMDSKKTYEIINKLQGVTYDMKSGKQGDLGFIAQDVEKYVPEVVQNFSGMKALDYAKITSLLVEAFKYQSAQVDDLRVQVEAIKA